MDVKQVIILSLLLAIHQCVPDHSNPSPHTCPLGNMTPCPSPPKCGDNNNLTQEILPLSPSPPTSSCPVHNLILAVITIAINCHQILRILTATTITIHLLIILQHITIHLLIILQHITTSSNPPPNGNDNNNDNNGGNPSSAPSSGENDNNKDNGDDSSSDSGNHKAD
jgi:hypothetical protein